MVKWSISLILFVSSVSVVSGQADSAKTNWYIPEYTYLQFAGGQGMFSLGAVYAPWLKTQAWIGIGYTPPSHGNITTLSGRFLYETISIKIGEHIFIKPFNAGVFTNVNFSKNIPLSWASENYPKKYYWWSSALRYGPVSQTSVEFNFKSVKFCPYIDFSTNDLYISSIYGNASSISAGDILVLGLGFRLKFTW